MRWVCLLFPRLALEGALRRRPDPEAPFALVDGPAQRQCIRAANRAAREQGVRPGQARGFAEALFNAPESARAERLETEPFDAGLVERWRRRLASWAYGFSAQVSLHYPHALVF